MQYRLSFTRELCLLFAGVALAAGQAQSGMGKVYPPTLTADVPKPVAFFPLTDGSGQNLTSFPSGTYTGIAQGSIPWVNDEVFGSVLQCNKHNQDLIMLDPVDYASMGPFTINLWERANATDQEGDLFQYIFSHSAYANRTQFAPVDAFHPNQIHIYLPESDHPADGLVRTVVKDSTDLDTTAFLDSDGHYNDNTVRKNINGNPANDGAWHMITVTTHTDGSAGYEVYVDGMLAAALPGSGSNAVNATLANPQLLLDGGHPIFLQNGTIYLCGRSDGDPTRSYSGAVSHLGLWNTVLTPAQILNLYRTVVVSTASTFGAPASAPAGAQQVAATMTAAAPVYSAGDTSSMQMPAPSPGSSVTVVAAGPQTSEQMTIAGRPCQFPFFYKGQVRNACVPYSSADSSAFCMDVDGRFAMCSPSPVSAYSTFQSWLDQWAGKGALQTANGMNGMQEVVTCNVTSTTDDPAASPCARGYVCAPLPQADIRAADNAAQSASTWGLSPIGNPLQGAAMGVCASPDGVALPVGPTVPVPTAYFPLTNGSTFSWPIPEYWAYNTSAIQSKQTKFVKDSYFGTVVQCNASLGSSLAIEGVQWGRTGPFAMNIWVKQLTDSGSLFQYILSTRNRTLTNVTDDSIFYPNQVHLYLPSQDHPAHDTVRAIVKDDTDVFNGDSSRVWVDSDGVVGSNNERSTIRTPMLGGWHMVTITTMTNGNTGFRLYVDGLFTAALSSPQDFFQVDGGRPIYADGPITLCDRADRVPGRNFDGRLAQLSIYDAALSEGNVALLYEAVTGQVPDYTKSPAAQAAAGEAAMSPQSAAAPGEGAAAAPKPTLTPAASAPSSAGSQAAAGSAATPSQLPDDISVYDLTGLPGTSPPAQAQPVPNPAIVKQPVGVSGTAADASKVGVNGASAGPSGRKLAPGAIAGIVVAVFAGLAVVAAIAALVVRKRRQGGSWHKAQLEGAARPGDGRGPGGAGNAVQTSFPDSQAVPKRPSPEKMNQKLFTGPSSNAFSLEASSAL